MMYGYGLGWGVWGMVMMFLFWGGGLVLFFWLLKWVLNPRGDKGSTPKAILDQRYASGTISKDDYESLKKDLSI